MSAKEDEWWNCPKCGALTEIVDNDRPAWRECTECNWNYTPSNTHL